MIPANIIQRIDNMDITEITKALAIFNLYHKKISFEIERLSDFLSQDFGNYPEMEKELDRLESNKQNCAELLSALVIKARNGVRFF